MLDGRDPAEAAFIARFLARVPAEAAASFTPEQLAAVQRAFGMRYATRHAVDVRRGVRLPWGRYYVVLLAGREPRADGHRPARWLLGAVVSLLSVGVFAVW